MSDLSTSLGELSGFTWLTKCKFWYEALGVREEFSRHRFDWNDFVSVVVAPALALVCVYGLVHVVLYNDASLPVGHGSILCATPECTPLLYLLEIVAMGGVLIAALLLFFRADAWN
ncbi:hypothetical protein LQ948_05215 [Jiella sp. MQZ9-1]|uniref:Uncharacterized protein n=1 Tax=Jiella flava TaxID=2816857 RepID=A0A939FV39_9HYPH|nr:hypothetical protein [Jiella flava]MBO0662067.1 hypothetical protein [Jiella flava]MCD2470605.1 hypothetical protein [Jiella flava]